MPCQRGKVLASEAERRLFRMLRALVADYNADVHLKVRLADALDLKNSGISNELFSYGICAHFDFVVVDRNTFQSLFAVEYDGAEHFVQGDTIVRDRKKSEICRKLNFDLLRITKCHLEDVFMGKTQLQFLVEGWLTEHSAQGRDTQFALIFSTGNRG